MEFKEAIKLALQSLWQNKLRTVLTLLGVMIGVASVIAVVTLVNGANTYVTTKFTSYGADVFTVSRLPAIITNSTEYERYQKRKDMLVRRYRTCEDNCKRCVGMGAQQTTVAKVTRGTQVGHRLPRFAATRGRCRSCRTWTLRRGAGLRRRMRSMRRTVAIIGTDIRDNLFRGVDPLGQELRVDGSRTR